MTSQSNMDMVDLKPIQDNDLPFIDSEEDMREFLEKQEDGSYKLITSSVNGCIDRDWIEVPEGASVYAEDSNMGVKGDYFFRLRSKGFDYEAIWLEGNWMKAAFDICNMNVLWQRHPEQDKPFLTLNDQYAEIERVRQTAFDKQISGGHYKSLPIQPMKFALANGLDHAQGNVIKYVIRHASKGGKDDLLKAIHNIELMIEHYYG